MREKTADLMTEIATDKLLIVTTHYPEHFKGVGRYILMSGGADDLDERLVYQNFIQENIIFYLLVLFNLLSELQLK